MKIRYWLGFKIHFVDKDGEWWAVADDVCAALGLENAATMGEQCAKHTLSSKEDIFDRNYTNQEINIINELGVYHLSFNKPGTEDFRCWFSYEIKSLAESRSLKSLRIVSQLMKKRLAYVNKNLNNYGNYKGDKMSEEELLEKINAIFDELEKVLSAVCPAHYGNWNGREEA